MYRVVNELRLYSGIDLSKVELMKRMQRCNIDPHTCTPVDLLHVIKLGLIKHLLCATINDFCETGEYATRFCALWNDADMSNLECNVSFDDLLQHHASFIGREHFVVGQILPLILYQLGCSNDDSLAITFETWCHLSYLSKLLYCKDPIFNIEEEVQKLEKSIDLFIASLNNSNPALLSKHKIHQLRQNTCEDLED